MRGFLLFFVLAGLFSAMLGGNLTVPKADSDQSAPRIIDATDEAGELSAGAQNSADGAVQLDRSYDGHFYADVEINGAQIRALVDTGATGIALSREDARKAGLAVSIGMPGVVGQGADGDVRGEYVTLDRVTLGHKSVENMSAIVLNGGEQTLLGQTFLSKFEAVEIRGDKMALR